MSVELVNGHVLFPHRSNWSTPPDMDRSWQSNVIDSEFGDETRFSLRQFPRRTVRWYVTARDLTEQSQLADRILAAKRSGLACAPAWGRSCELAAAVTAAAVQVEPTLWPWAQGDFLLLIDDGGNHDARQVASVLGNVLTLSVPVSRPYHAGLLIWPLIFGKFVADSLQLITMRNGHATLSISELTSPDSADRLGTPGPGGEGIGFWYVEQDFVVQ